MLDLDSKQALWPRIEFSRALEFAAHAHQGQMVPGTDLPYVVHLTRVVTEMMIAVTTRLGVDTQLALHCALLHDVLEDTPVTDMELMKEFGEKIAAGVRALTKDKSLPKALAMTDSLCRIKQQPYEIWIVKMADRISNLGPPPGYWDREKILAYGGEAKMIRDALGEASAYLRARLTQKIERFVGYADALHDLDNEVR